MLLLKFIGTHLKLIPEGPHIVEAFEYRNLAPLYCSEELRLCAKEKIAARMDDARMYDVWIEGPTGGMAVKGLVRTVRRPNGRTSLPRVSNPPSGKVPAKERPRQSKSEKSNGTAHYIGHRVRKVAVELESDTTDREPPTTRARYVVTPMRKHIVSPERKPTVPADAATTVLSPSSPSSPLPVVSQRSEQLLTSSANLPGLRRYLRAHRQQYRRRHSNFKPYDIRSWLRQIREHSLNPIDSSDTGPLVRAVHVPIPMRIRKKFVDRNKAWRTTRSRVPFIWVAPIPVTRYHYAAEERKFEKWGARLVSPRPRVQYVVTEESSRSQRASRLARSRAARAAARGVGHDRVHKG